MDWREVRTRVAWGGAFLVVGCMLPYFAQRWMWSPAQVTVVNGSTGEVLRDVEVVVLGEKHAVGELGPDVSHQIPVRAASAGLPIRVRYGARGRTWETRAVVPAGTCCGDRLKLALAPERSSEPLVMDTP
ncbi:hypothetical protein HPC49_15105 [Pyxidicoccus fallax]|uniref:Lipoprotein n=1 Tax=Pyxidicoccus fallax TaxID=394095 RepID=A0A848LIU9_9BACT|nr:hypothetical protein [Pyxidicoccus fallax]NMO17651.1 hypothetical protein [Pyxidicoccus fallax]NPC79559.1 hypothetical protein [Pyxidicoccus fallax]